MSTGHARTAKHLVFEQLESRALLDGMSFFDNNATLDSYNLQPGTGTFLGGGFPNEAPAIPVTSMGDFSPTAGFGFGGNANLTPNPGSFDTTAIGRTGAVNANATNNGIRTADDAAALRDPRGDGASAAPTAGSGVGQMTITTGANTLGIGSFATATNGFNSESGGTGRPGGKAAAAKEQQDKNSNDDQGDLFDLSPGKASNTTSGAATTKPSANVGASGSGK